MLGKLRDLGSSWIHREAHPLADARELRQIIDEITVDNAFKAVDEILGWLESARDAADFPEDRLLAALTQLDDAAQPHLRKLTRDYLHAPRLTRAEEKRLWSIGHGFWSVLAEGYERCLAVAEDKTRPGEAVREGLAALCSRLLLALGNALKWTQFHYGPSAVGLWQRMGAALLAAEKAGVAEKAATLRGCPAGTTTPQREYARWVAFHAASMDGLLPLQIELGERLIGHFAEGLALTAKGARDSVYWTDLGLAQSPLRMAQMPHGARPTQRFFRPGAAHAGLAGLLHDLERGDDVPAGINLGGQYHARGLLPVLRHLVAYLAPIPPQRRHKRHRVKQRAGVVNGLVNAILALSGQLAAASRGVAVESWVVEDISRGGFGAVVNSLPGEWLKVGALIAMHPEGGQSWQLGIVRRCHRVGEAHATVGIETLALQAEAVELRMRTASSVAMVAGVPALMIRDGVAAGHVSAVMPVGSFDLREPLDWTCDGRRLHLVPEALVEQGDDYELARYRVGGA